MAYGYYEYTVSSLLHEAGRHRRHHSCGHNLEYCCCEDDHVIELRLVVDALNQLPDDTYSANLWQRKLVDFFNSKHQNSMCLPHRQHAQKTRAVDKWLRWEILTDARMGWINEIRETWANTKDQLKGFRLFKRELDHILAMDDYYYYY